jgi:hypothetical protein
LLYELGTCENSSIYLHLQSKLSNGTTYHSAYGKLSSTIHIMEFVDDINLETNKDAYHHEPDTAGLIPHMNHVGQVGHDTLWASVGELSLGKCQYHLMRWLFSASGSPVLQGDKFEDHVSICARRMVPMQQSGNSQQVSPTKRLALLLNQCNTNRLTTRLSWQSPNCMHVFSRAAPAKLHTPGYTATVSSFVALDTCSPSATSFLTN